MGSRFFLIFHCLLNAALNLLPNLKWILTYYIEEAVDSGIPIEEPPLNAHLNLLRKSEKPKSFYN